MVNSNINSNVNRTGNNSARLGSNNLRNGNNSVRNGNGNVIWSPFNTRYVNFNHVSYICMCIFT